MLTLRLLAPFGAFRQFTAGSYRPTAPFVTPSAAYGMLLNFAGIEMRWDDGKSSMTRTRQDLPGMAIALGTTQLPEVQTLYQQLHNYPVGATGRERAEECKGNKYNIQPIRREFLSGIDASLYVRCDDSALEVRIVEGLAGNWEGAGRRYGLPFLGDNNLLIDKVGVEAAAAQTRWLRLLTSADRQARSGRMRLPITIDRADMTQTRAGLFAWSETESSEPPDDAWVRIGGGD